MNRDVNFLFKGKDETQSARKSVESGFDSLNAKANLFNRTLQTTDRAIAQQGRNLSIQLKAVAATGNQEQYLNFLRANQKAFTSLSTAVKAGSLSQTDYNRRIGLLSPELQNALSTVNRFGKSITELGAASDQTSGLFKTFQNIFVGTFTGNVAADVLIKIAQITQALVSMGVEAIQTGAKFEATQYALTAIVGGSQTASKELSAVDRIAQNTPGLRLDSAEKGYQQLRNLGFAAEFAQKFIKGIGTQRLLSGADESAVQRVTVNFTQLANGSNRAAQDIREILHAMPSLKNAFIDAFGTLDGKKIAQQFKNPKEALEKLLDSMNKTGQVAGGAANAYEVFLDRVVLSQREFAKPTLRDAAKLFEVFTKVLKENGANFKALGETVSDALRGITSGLEIVSSVANSALGSVVTQLAKVAAYASNPLIALLIEGGKLQKKADNLFSALEPSDSDLEDYYSKIEEKENVALIKRKTAEAEAAQAREQIVQENRDKIDAISKKGFAVLESSYKSHAAQIRSTVATTYAEEVAQQRQSYQLEQNYLLQKYRATAEYYNKKYALAQDDKEREKIKSEGSIELGGIKTDYMVNRFEADRRAEEMRRQEYERQRSITAESYSLMASDAQIYQNIELAKLNENFDKRLLVVTDYQTKASKVVNDSYDRMAQASGLSLDSELKKLGQSEEEKQNIRTKYVQMDNEREESRRRSLAQIRERAEDEAIRLLEKGFERRRQLSDAYAEQTETRFRIAGALINGLFNFDTRSTVAGIQKEITNLSNIYGKDYAQIPQLTGLGTVFNDADKKPFKNLELDFLSAQNKTDLEGFTKKRDELTKLRDEYKKYGKDASDVEHEITVLAEQEYQTRLNYQLSWSEKYAQTLDGIKEKIKGLREGNKISEINVADDVNIQIAQETLSTLTQIKYLERTLIPNAQEVADRRKLAYLSALKEIVNAEEEAVQRIDAAQLQLAVRMEISTNQIKAQVLEGLASQKTLNEGIADGILETYDKIADKLDENIEKVFKWAGAFSSLFTEPLKVLNRSSLTDTTTKLLDTFLPGVGSKLDYEKNPVVGELKESNKYLKTIASAIQPVPGVPFTASGGGILGAATSIFGGNLGNRNGINSPLIMNLTGGGGDSFDEDNPFGFLSGGASPSPSGGFFSKIKNLFSTKDGGLFAPRQNLLTGKTSKIGGIAGGIGDLASMIAPLFGGGRLSSVIGMAGQGASIGAMFGGGIGAGIGAAAGAILGLFTGGTRKQDEVARTEYKNQALAALDKIIGQLGSKPSTIQPPSEAGSQADQVLSQYQAAIATLKDSKTRRIANDELKPTEAIGYKRKAVDAAIRGALEWQISDDKRKDVASRFTGEFAEGTFFKSSDYLEFKRRNGMLSGTFTGRDHLPALLADGEMVLNPKQIQSVRNAAGFDAFAYAEIPNYPKAPVLNIPKFADGFSFAAPVSNTANRTAEPPKIEIGDIVINLNGKRITDAEIESIAINGVKKKFNKLA